VNELVKSLKFVEPESPGTLKKFQVPGVRTISLLVLPLTGEALQLKRLQGTNSSVQFVLNVSLDSLEERADESTGDSRRGDLFVKEGKATG
jgi:hypothetical protein